MKNTLLDRVRKLPDMEKLALVDQILTDLDRPDPEIDAAWAQEVRRRKKAYQSGKMKSCSYEDVRRKLRRS